MRARSIVVGGMAMTARIVRKNDEMTSWITSLARRARGSSTGPAKRRMPLSVTALAPGRRTREKVLRPAREAGDLWLSRAREGDAMGLIEVRGACPHDCPDNCAWVATVDDGVVTGVHGNPDHPITAGHLCIKVQKYEERAYHPDRLLTPLVRTGPKGSASFREATWEEALGLAGRGCSRQSTVAERRACCRSATWAPPGVLQGGPSMDMRFFNTLGAAKIDGTICFAAGATAWGMTYGGWPAADIEDAVHARSVVAWGANMVSTHLHLWKFFLDARKRGATIVCVDPVRTRTAKAADIHLPLRPGSDAALALGAMHVLFAEGLADDAFLDEHTEGADELRARAAEWPLSPRLRRQVSAKRTSRSFARLLAEGPTFLKIGPGAQRHADAGTGIRAAIMLPAVTGAWRHQGGGVLVHSAGAFAHPEAKMAKPELRGDRPQRNVNMVLLGQALAGTLDDNGPLTGLVVYNSNPAVVVPDSASVRAGLAREDLFTVAIEQFPTETVSFADVVLPATTQLEHPRCDLVVGPLLPDAQPARRSLRGARAVRTPRSSGCSLRRWPMTTRGSPTRGSPTTTRHCSRRTCAAYPDDIVEQLRDQGFAKLAVPKRSGSKIKLSTGAVPAPDGRDPEPDDGRFTLLTPKSHHFLNSTFVNHGRLAHMAGGPQRADGRPRRGSSRHRRRSERASAQRARRGHRRRRARR